MQHIGVSSPDHDVEMSIRRDTTDTSSNGAEFFPQSQTSYQQVVASVCTAARTSNELSRLLPDQPNPGTPSDLHRLVFGMVPLSVGEMEQTELPASVGESMGIRCKVWDIMGLAVLVGR